MGREKPALIAANGMRRDVSGHARDFDDAFFAAGGVEKLSAWFRANEEKCAMVPGSAMGACIARPSKIVCVGLNYTRHAAETGKEVPKEPAIFMKAPSACAGRSTTW
jgi:2,4-diketo-3-deoxy-L-fuconate hydrolase